MRTLSGILMVVMAAALLLPLSGCTNTQAGTVIGTAAGAAVGYQVGDDRTERQRNAVIGGVLGGAGGYYVGDRMDQVKYCPKCGLTYTQEAQYCTTDGTPLQLRDGAR